MLTTFFEMIKYSFPQDDHVAPRCVSLTFNLLVVTISYGLIRSPPLSYSKLWLPNSFQPHLAISSQLLVVSL